MNFYFLCATQPYNVGDLLINKMLIDELCKYGTVYVDCYNIPDTFKCYILENNNAIDVYKMSGFSVKNGDIISFCFFLLRNNIKYFTQSPGPLGKLSKSYSLYFKLISCLLKSIKIKYCLIGNCCSNSLALNEKISIRNADIYLVRSGSSLRYLSKCGIKNVHYIPDLAFLYREKALIMDSHKVVTFCFREIYSNYDSFVEWLKRIIRLLHDRGYRIEFIYQVAKDKSFLIKIKNDLSDMPDISFIEDIIWYDNIQYYSGKSIIISNRLHSLLLGVIHNAVPLALCYNDARDAKIVDVYNSVFKDLSTELIVSEDSVDKIEKILSNIDCVKDKIVKIADCNSKMCHHIINKLCHSV